MPVEVELKLKDLVKIALGAPTLNHVHVTVLHSLLDILLKKLNCQNEAVTVDAYEGGHLDKILQGAKISPLAFDDTHVECIGKRLQMLDQLERDVQKLDDKLECHLKEAKRPDNSHDIKVDFVNWECYAGEQLCTLCDPNDAVACMLLKNTDFMRKMLRRISSPMVERVFVLEDKLKLLHEEFMAFVKRAEEAYVKIICWRHASMKSSCCASRSPRTMPNSSAPWRRCRTCWTPS